jgi:hypothetical protein
MAVVAIILQSNIIGIIQFERNLDGISITLSLHSVQRMMTTSTCHDVPRLLSINTICVTLKVMHVGCQHHIGSSAGLAISIV